MQPLSFSFLFLFIPLLLVTLSFHLIDSVYKKQSDDDLILPLQELYRSGALSFFFFEFHI